MAEASKSNPAPAASAPSFDEWRSRLDAGARQAGIGAAQQPAAGFPRCRGGCPTPTISPWPIPLRADRDRRRPEA